MNPTLRTCFAVTALFCATAAGSFAAADSTAPIAVASGGYVDFGRFVPSSDGRFVEVNLSTGLLKFAAACAATTEPQAAALLGNLKHVRVNVVELNDGNRAATLDRVQTIRRELEAQGWTSLANVREQPKGDDVQIFAKMRGEEAIEGLAVTVISGSREVVLVNIVGEIKPDQIATLAERFHVDSLKDVNLPKSHHS